MTSPRPPISNNTVPRSAVMAFGIVFGLVMIALPFGLFAIMSGTQNQSHGMMLAGISGLPLDARTLRPTSRENADTATIAARYEIPASDRARLRDALRPCDTPPADLLATLATLAPNEARWIPGKTGPWFYGDGAADGRRWRALFSENSGTLWICDERASTPAK